ncbi:hypothetical protein INT80_02565 [Gallibacterium anatis]|uniref:Uncharacterized protein n=1 Tax=Gallibacterium anatis TaxID=750 RepID=A0A930UQW2_9PAST|nr:hypothetical protein [Gallibacterium anatis]
MSACGFSLEDLILGPQPPQPVFTVTFILGGCSGSTTGGIKIFRFQIMFQVLKHQNIKIDSSNSISAVHYNRHTVSNETVFGIVMLIFSYFMIMAVLAVCRFPEWILKVRGAQQLTISNVGPGFGNEVGASGSMVNDFRYVIGTA